MLSQGVLQAIRTRPALKEKLIGFARSVGYDPHDWVRTVMYEKCFEFVRSLGPEKLSALEVSAGPQWRRDIKFGRYEETQYPEYDICAGVLPRTFDLIIADQIFEHLKWPYRAGRNVHAMLKPGGHFVVATPFLVKVHKAPTDCSRWTDEGMYYFLQECGFRAEDIQTFSWGNRACLKSNLTAWTKRGFTGSLKNEPDFPVMVWAFAKKAEAPADP